MICNDIRYSDRPESIRNSAAWPAQLTSNCSYMQWRRSVVKSDGSGFFRSSHQTADRNSFSFSAPKMGCSVIFGFFSFRPKNEFSFLFYFSFSFQKCHLRWAENVHVRNWTVTKFCDRATGDFRFVFPPRKDFHFRRRFRLRPKMKNAFSVGLYTSNCFRLHPTSMIFKHLTIPVLDSL